LLHGRAERDKRDTVEDEIDTYPKPMNNRLAVGSC